MKSKSLIMLVIGTLLLGLMLEAGITLTSLNRKTKIAWVEVSVLLNKRLELIKDLTTISRKHIKGEPSVLNPIDEALQKLSPLSAELPSSSSLEQIYKNESLALTLRAELLQLTAKILELNSDPNLREIQDQGDRVENRLIVTKGRYINLAEKLNTQIHSPTGYVIAKILAISAPSYFESALPTGPKPINFVNFKK